MNAPDTDFAPALEPLAPSPEVPGQAAPETKPAPALDTLTASDEGTPITALPEPSDIERLLADPKGPFTLSSGTPVVIRPLKLREFLKLLRIITRGSASMLSSLSLDFDDVDKFVQTLVAMALFAVPEAEEETLDFVQAMLDPAGLGVSPEADNVLRSRLFLELDNPEMEDVINIIGAVIASEGADLHALGKKTAAMWSAATKMGLTKGVPVRSQGS